MGKDHSHHAPVLTNVDPTAHDGSLTTRRRQMATDDPVATDDDEGGCRGYTPQPSSIINTVGPNSVNNLNHDNVAKNAVDDSNSNITHGHGPLSASPRITRVASPVLAKDFAQLARDGASPASPVASTAGTSTVAQNSPKPILKNSSSKKGGKHRHKHHHKHRHHNHNSSSVHKDVITAAADADVQGDGDNATTTRGRQSSITAADERSNIKTETKANTTANATSPSVTPTNNKTTFSPLANPLIGKALKSLVRSSSEPGTPRNVAGGAGNRRGVPAAGISTDPDVDPATAGAGAEKATFASASDEKAALAGEKIFSVGGGENTASTRKTHHSNSMPPLSSSSASRKHPSGIFNNNKDSGTGAGGSLPLARSSEPHLPTSRTGFEEYEDLSDYPPVNHNLHSHHHGAHGHGHGHQQEGAAPGVGLASGGTGPPIITFEGLLEPEKPLKPPPTWRTSAWNICTYSWLNVMLVFIPVSWACHFAGVNDTAIFCVSFAAIIPLAALLGFATEELALRVGHTLGGLMNATFGNAVELIIAILALVKGELRIVQSAMIGSILSNCLLVLGCCFFAGGIRFHEQIYTIRSAQLNISLLGISALVIVIPAAFNAAVIQLGTVPVSVSDRDILKLSRGVAFILLFVYAAYLFFQFWTHSYLYRAATTQHHRSLRARSIVGDDEPQPPTDTSVLRIPSWHSSSSSSSSSSSDDSDSTHSRDVEAEGESPASTAVAGSGSGDGSSGGTSPAGHESEAAHSVSFKGGAATSTAMTRTRSNATTNTTRSISSSRSSSSSSNSSNSSFSTDSDEEDHETPKLKVHAALVLIVVVTAITGLTAEYLVDSIDGLTDTGNISREFVALILLPLVGNAAEHVTAVTVSVKDKLDLSMAVAVGSSIQISLFVIPILVLLGWCIGQPLTLEFDVLETIILFVSIIIVNQAISDGKTNWMEGAVLMSTYVVIALSMWFYPGSAGL